MWDSRTFSNLKGALDLKSSLEDVSKYRSGITDEVISAGVKGDLRNLMPLVSSKGEPFGAKLLPGKEYRVVVPSNVTAGSGVIFQKGDEKSYGILVESNVKGGKQMSVREVDEVWWKDWQKEHPGSLQLILSEKDVMIMGQTHVKKARELNKTERFMDILVGWWLVDFDSDKPMWEILVRLIGGTVLIGLVMYGIGNWLYTWYRAN